MADEIIGRWQFHLICKNESTAWLNPNWQSATSLKKTEIKFKPSGWFVHKLEGVEIIYADEENDAEIVKAISFRREYGFIYGHLINWAGSAHEGCMTPEYMIIWEKIKLGQLLINGRNK